jgi:hypothetical protein
MLHFIFKFLEIIFLIGMVGSLAVICITMVEDLKILFEKDEPAPGTLAQEPSSHVPDHAVVAD